MAREISEIQESIIESIEEDSTLSAKLTSTSITAIWRLITYVVAVCAWTVEKLFDAHQEEVDETVDTKAHSLLWYRNKALAFQYGYSLNEDTYEYDEEDEDAQIVQFAAASESDTDVRILRVKVAKDEDGSLAELSESELDAFEYYLGRVKDAGVKIRVISQEADMLKLEIDLYYDPLVLNSEGQRLDGTGDTPVQDAITNYLENLPFDGEYTNMAMVDSIQEVEGVKIPDLVSAEYKWGDYDWEAVSARYTPEAGWLKVYDDYLTINWIAYE